MKVEPEINPTVARRELAVYFRGLREQRGHSLAELGELLGVAQSQASRLDTGARGFRVEDIRRLCDWYGLAAGERRRLLALADEARRRAWWQQYDLDDSYRTLIGFEQAAQSINEFCNVVVPGLLQTRQYARASAELAEIRNFKVAEAVDVRLRRQEVLNRPVPPEVSVVIDEVVLARGAGGSDVMKEQLQHLLNFGERPQSTLRVISFEAGMYPVAASQFIMLRMKAPLPDLYYSEDQVKRNDSSDEDIIGQTRVVWRRMEQIALSPVRSAELIARYRDRLTSSRS